MELVDPIMRVMVGRQIKYHINVAYRWWKQGDSAPHRTVIGRADVLWIQYCISTCTATFPPRVRDAFPMGAFPVVTNHMRVLKYDEHG
jgi:hypothetical protein